MKILVTGGAGFIGGNYINIMLKKHPEDEIICLDALTYAGNIETSNIINKMIETFLLFSDFCITTTYSPKVLSAERSLNNCVYNLLL